MSEKIKVTMDNIDATTLAMLFVDMAKEVGMRVGHRKGGTQGSGIIPFDTGALQESIRIGETGKNHATVIIGSEDVFYAELLEFSDLQENGFSINLHKGFVENFALGFYAQRLREQLEKAVDCKIERGQE